jgi:hypothetical protein
MVVVGGSIPLAPTISVALCTQADRVAARAQRTQRDEDYLVPDQRQQIRIYRRLDDSGIKRPTGDPPVIYPSLA